MSRISGNIYKDHLLTDGYDYMNQAWVVNGKYVRCGHPESMDCGCFGKRNEGLSVEDYIASTMHHAGIEL